ncbi:uncharacterized protein BJ212DRAFT_1485330 [Suillus subaureus]|uniref:Uncharacterized protein n=1 Tax=Suillus subaureus TaxID=48587 RepID=A0A9P7E1D0_9AGAM|nr:uncharacterized protein BJ212DRAFT_1485330 [Suillus subaureus]KAG1808053.1 hypothetical protein BJ212DRAFT_1485330 [Suillus subaureus]
MKEVILMMYEDKSWDFEVHYWDLWEWAADLLRDPCLFLHLTFDAQHLSKFDGENFVWFIDEPYTADAFWDLQLQLPEGAKPLTFILYADKTKLSTSGTAKAYPIVARLANLPTDICNGEGIGGGYVVSWLPVKYLNDLGRDVVSHIDKRFKEFPCWHNQKHPNQVMDIVFTDSSIPENILKMILYAAHDVVTEEDCMLGYLLLQCICLYIEVDMYASLEVHTSDTICEGRNVVQMFSGFLKQYIDKTVDIEDKGWNFLKLHMDVHLFDDIEVKGATWNYNMKPNKKMHGPLKDSYLLWTNFQNVAEQILHINHWQLITEDIHCHLLDFNEYLHLQTQDQFDAADDAVIPLAGFFHVKVGSKQPPLTFELVENIYHSDNAFSNLCIRLNDFLNDFLPAINIPLPQGKWIRL